MKALHCSFKCLVFLLLVFFFFFKATAKANAVFSPALLDQEFFRKDCCLTTLSLFFRNKKMAFCCSS